MLHVILLFLIFSLIESKITQNDFCHSEKELECKEKLNYTCNNKLCSKSEYSCKVISLFSNLNGVNKKKYKLFLKKIKTCPKLTINRKKKNDVCLNTKQCKLSSNHRAWFKQMILGAEYYTKKKNKFIKINFY
jgi:hypothetical protein